jgi:putative heme iron utilization protein
MDATLGAELRQLVSSRVVAALGTIHTGAPYVSMTPFALLPDGRGFVVHVSALAAHTKDMLADPRVSLLIMAAEEEHVQPQALPRVTILGRARQLSAGTAEHSLAQQAYLARFPDSAQTFELADFSLFIIDITQARWIGGFAQARSLTPETFAKAATDGSEQP